MKRLTAVFIVIVGGITASFITFSTDTPEKSGVFTTSSNDSKFTFEKQENSTRPRNPQNNRTNLTDTLTQAYLEEVVRRNPEGPQIIDDIPQLTVPTEETFQTLLSNYLNTAFEWNKVDEKSIKISSETQTSFTAAYLDSIRDLVDEKTRLLEKEVIALSDFLEKGNDASLRKVIEELNLQLEKVLEISSPSKYKELHLRLANFLQKQIAIYNAVLKANDDPVKAVLAINEIPETGEELESLRTTIE